MDSPVGFRELLINLEKFLYLLKACTVASCVIAVEAVDRVKIFMFLLKMFPVLLEKLILFGLFRGKRQFKGAPIKKTSS